MEILSKNEYDSIIDDKKKMFNSRYKYTIFNKISKEMTDKVIVNRIDADKNKSLFNALGYKGLPVIIVIKNGKQSFFKNEFDSEEELRKAL